MDTKVGWVPDVLGELDKKKIFIASLVLGSVILGCTLKKSIESAPKTSTNMERPFDGDWKVAGVIHLKSTHMHERSFGSL